MKAWISAFFIAWRLSRGCLRREGHYSKLSPAGLPVRQSSVAVAPPIAVTSNLLRKPTSQRSSLGTLTVSYSYLAFFLSFFDLSEGCISRGRSCPAHSQDCHVSIKNYHRHLSWSGGGRRSLCLSLGTSAAGRVRVEGRCCALERGGLRRSSFGRMNRF